MPRRPKTAAERTQAYYRRRRELGEREIGVWLDRNLLAWVDRQPERSRTRVMREALSLLRRVRDLDDQ